MLTDKCKSDCQFDLCQTVSAPPNGPGFSLVTLGSFVVKLFLLDIKPE